jgi:hypothetical protein
VQQNPALADVLLCTVTGCSRAVHADRLYLYQPGNPHVTSVSPPSGPAAGHTKVTIHGANLGCALAVFFGKVKASSFTQPAARLDCGSTITLLATSPAGNAGAKVGVSVETIESSLPARATAPIATFTYRNARAVPRGWLTELYAEEPALAMTLAAGVRSSRQVSGESALLEEVVGEFLLAGCGGVRHAVQRHHEADFYDVTMNDIYGLSVLALVDRVRADVVLA